MWGEFSTARDQALRAGNYSPASLGTGASVGLGCVSLAFQLSHISGPGAIGSVFSSKWYGLGLPTCSVCSSDSTEAKSLTGCGGACGNQAVMHWPSADC